ncbi:SNF2 domain-containing protein / helicase domain-containing protein / zinc finger protein-related [Zea mays]|uniref:SNF2 domain-containing protein / helicase domain-containing protein / zinc finger protein-related n=1 Tax=Zea mays TaxID=4577 RepID=A0A1D6GA65_MAIZE|nr:SNF2 domain-containing protein / helicase domain-containing protein / zinc finger protein-related [Zea mays]AQL00025.1 SNF2 domain-containing protein / helicase domain-containing protein / zinc finger protein-related [Zea mays]
MAEEPVVGYDGFEAAGDAGAGGAEDNLSMSLGDFMAFLETEPTSPEEGWKEEQQMQPAVNQGCLEMPANTDCSEDLFQSHEEMLENAEFWSKSNYSPVEHLECHMEVNMELNEGEQMIDHTEASRYELFSNDLQSQSRTSNLDNEHFPRDASNHANVEATGPPYDLSNGGISTEHSDWSEIKWGSTDEMLGNTGQDDDHFTPMGMFCLTNNTDILDLSCIESNMGERTESIRNGNSSCLTMQEEHLQAECGGYPHPDYISVDMIDERSLHDLPHGLSQNNEQYEMEQLPQNICESGSMQMASPDQYCSSPDQYCDDTSLSDFYMDVSSPESISCEQNQPEDIFFKSESSTDSSPVPSSRNSTTEDADKYLGQPSKQLLDSKIVPFSNQHTFKNMEYQKPLVLDKQYAYRSNNSSIHNSTKGCFSRDGDMVSDLCVLEGNRNPAPAHLWPYQGKFHHNFQQPVYGNSIIPAFGGTRYKPHDERTTLRLALQVI